MYSYDYLFSRINLPKESISAISEAMKILSCDKKRMTDVFFSGGDAKAELTSVSSLHCEINEDLFWLAYIIILTERTYEIYREKNLSEDLFYDTMEDITIWVKRTKRDFGTWGIHGEFGWLSNHLRTALFRFGRIQFELSKHNRETYSKNGRTISRGETIINMHIPDDGHPLLRSLRQDSYNRAAEFFGLDVFVCNSWLLFPDHVKFLRGDSNVLDFMRDFEIIDSGFEEAKSNMWRVFNLRENYDPVHLPRDTGMRKAYAEWFEKGNLAGWGYGIKIGAEIK